MVELTDRIDVKAPINAVYSLWTRFERFPEFMHGVDSVTRQGDDELHWVVSIAGVEREFDATITEQRLDERVAWRSTDGKLHTGAVTFSRVDDEHTRVMLQMEWQPQGVVEQAGQLLGLDDLQVIRDLHRFKALAEGASAEATENDRGHPGGGQGN